MMKRWYWLIPLLLAVGVYAPAPWGELVWDDPLVFDRQLAAFKSIGDVFFPPENIFQWSNDYYRPVVILSYMLDLRLYGDAYVAGLHSSNVLYHVITTFFVWLLACRLLQHLPNSSVGAMLAAAIFAVHPIHTESVSWITGRSDVLATLFLVPSVTLALLWRDTGAKWALALGGVLYMLALLSKEVAVAALIMIPAALLLIPSPGNLQRSSDDTLNGKNNSVQLMWLGTAAMLFCVTAFYLLLRETDGVAYGHPLNLAWAEYLARFEKSTAYYFIKVIVPWPQSNHVAWESTPGSIVIIGVFLIAISLLALSISVWRRHRDGSLLFALMWFGITLAPSIAVAVRKISGTPLAERYLYLPSIGMALLLGLACCQPYFGKWAKSITWAVALLIIAYSVTTIERGIIWTSNLKLWTDTTAKVPSHGEPWNLLGIEYLAQRKYEKALDAFQHAIEEQNSAAGRSYAKRNIAIVYHYQNDLRRAEEYYLAALDEIPNNPEAFHGLGVVYLTQAEQLHKEGGQKIQLDRKLTLAVTNFESALRLNPFHPLARWGLVTALAHQGQRYERRGKADQAVVLYRSALAEIDKLIEQHPAFQSRLDIQEKRAGLRASLRRLNR
jgi:protein O-mannosyl-transferase